MYFNKKANTWLAAFPEYLYLFFFFTISLTKHKKYQEYKYSKKYNPAGKVAPTIAGKPLHIIQNDIQDIENQAQRGYYGNVKDCFFHI